MFARRIGVTVCAAIAVMVALVGEASAALDSGIATGLTAVQTDATALATLVWPVMIAIFGSLIVMKLFKRYGSKL